MKQAAVIVAGGAGTRMGSDTPKQFLEILGKPVILHTVDAFLRFDPGIKLVVVIASQLTEQWKEISGRSGKYKQIILAMGGYKRYDSVKSGLEHIGDGEIVGIHDAVRPLVSSETLRRCYETAAAAGSAIPVIKTGESVRMEDDDGNRSLDRRKIRLVQTPQVFRSDLLKEAFKMGYRESFTDDASVFEAIHGSVQLVPGNRENIKITFPPDLIFARSVLSDMQQKY